ncbi:HPr kinase/phosphorylase [Roseicyclus sp.]|uniref:HPr kinase/phosphorylase n=1 Tax=Roseicyclus sp. TaxID=1914329 RepID=UPI003F6D0448
MHPEPEPITRWVASRNGMALWLNATALAVDGRGLVILGAPGTGKSTLAIAMMALGAVLISDDGVWLQSGSAPAMLERPEQARDLIEARGIGLIRSGPTLAQAPLTLAVDLDRAETARLPLRHTIALGDSRVPLIHAAGEHGLAPALLLMMRQGRAEP